ncbi:MAG: hypothetical protein ABSA66_06330 [Roseiarcus sp.]|jgi:hypothetical protein
MHETPEITRLIHENLWIVMSFAFGQPAIAAYVDKRFVGEWKYLNKTIYERAEIRADRALLEMATQLRVLDDAEQLNYYLKQTKSHALGKVVQEDGSEKDLHFRDLTNKIMHAEKFEWVLSVPDHPKVICHSNDAARWKTAEVDLAALMGLIGMLMH